MRSDFRVARGTVGQRAVAGRVIHSRGHLQDLADGLDLELATLRRVVLVLVNEGNYLR